MLSKFADLHQLGAEIFEIQKKTPVPLVVVAGEKYVICAVQHVDFGVTSQKDVTCSVLGQRSYHGVFLQRLGI